MKLLNRIKYSLLVLLLNDICRREDSEPVCANCACRCQVKLQIGDEVLSGPGCKQQDILYQARKVWGLK